MFERTFEPLYEMQACPSRRQLVHGLPGPLRSMSHRTFRVWQQSQARLPRSRLELLGLVAGALIRVSWTILIWL
jgi:hypothetical protein